MEWRVERDLRIILIEDVLTPKLNAPGFVRTAKADTRVKYGETILLFLREQVGTGVVIAGHTTVDIHQTAHAIAADIRRPCDA